MNERSVHCTVPENTKLLLTCSGIIRIIYSKELSITVIYGLSNPHDPFLNSKTVPRPCVWWIIYHLTTPVPQTKRRQTYTTISLLLWHMFGRVTCHSVTTLDPSEVGSPPYSRWQNIPIPCPFCIFYKKQVQIRQLISQNVYFVEPTSRRMIPWLSWSLYKSRVDWYLPYSSS